MITSIYPLSDRNEYETKFNTLYIWMRLNFFLKMRTWDNKTRFQLVLLPSLITITSCTPSNLFSKPHQNVSEN